MPENDQGQLTGEALRSALVRSHDVFAVVASAGTTNAGIVDDLAGVAEVCERFGVWMHVDGRTGCGLSQPECASALQWIERADSFIVDPHKWLFATYDCCALLYRQPELARAAHSQHAGYLGRHRPRGLESAGLRSAPDPAGSRGCPLVQLGHTRDEPVRRSD